MQRKPHVDWQLAGRLSRRLLGDVPEVTPNQARQAVAELRVAGRRAGSLAVELSGLPGRPADVIRVTDRAGWVSGMSGMGRSVLSQLPLPERRPGLLRHLGAIGYGLASGVAMGVVGRQLLGQFDAFSDERALFLVAPNIVSLERDRRFVPSDFRLWVALHEQTHAVQFSGVPWLQPYLWERAQLIAADDLSATDIPANLRAGRGGLEAVVASPAGHRALDEVLALMTLVEGHADFISDLAGEAVIPTVAALRRAFARDATPSGLARALPMVDKGAQYRDGLSFCRAVHEKVGVPGLNRVFEGPEALPSLAEIREPAEWLRRVHGAA